MGRKTKFKPEYVNQAVELCANGATDRELAEDFGVAESTLYLWKSQYKAFSEAIKVAKSVADDRVEASLYRKAVGFTCADVHISNFQGKITVTPIIKYNPPDTTAAIFWLKNRKPDEWRDIKAIEHSGGIEHRTISAEPMTPEEWEAEHVDGDETWH